MAAMFSAARTAKRRLPIRISGGFPQAFGGVKGTLAALVDSGDP